MSWASLRGQSAPLFFIGALLAGNPRPASAQIYDSDNVVLLAHVDDHAGYSDIWGFVGNNGREYVILHTLTSSAWYDVQDPIHPVLVADIPGPASSWRDAFDIGNFVYIGTEGGGGIQIVDISNPANPTLVNTYSATVGNSHTVFGDRARKLVYVMGGFADGASGGLQILDCTNPTNLVEVGRWTNQYVHDLSAEGNIVHANLINIGRFRLLDLTNPAAPLNLGLPFADPTGASHSSWPFGDGVHVLITEETTGGRLKTANISNPSAITLDDDYNPAPSTSAHNPHIQGNMAAVSWYSRGTRLISITDPANLTEIGYLDTSFGTGLFSGNWGTFPHFPSGLIASSDIQNGLFLFKYEPNAGTLDGVVSSSAGGTLAGALVEFTNLDLEQVTAAPGAYRFAAFPGAGYKIRFSAFGYNADSVTVAVGPNLTTTTNVTLQKLPSGGVSGIVRDAISLVPLEGAELELVGTPMKATTGPAGSYSFPDVPVGTYPLLAVRYGYDVPLPFSVNITAGGSTIRNVDLTPATVYESFAAHSGWTVTTDPSVTGGAWVFGEPNGTFTSGLPFQTDFDHTLSPETQCAVTGNALVGGIGDDDVDGGATRLLSPVYDLSAMAAPRVFYYRWYAVNSVEDRWVVEVTDNGGANWVELESTDLHQATWTGRDFGLSGVISSFNAVQFRFTAQDPDPGQVVEAALDDFTIYEGSSGATGAPYLPTPRVPLELAQNWPNPFATVTSIRFSIPKEAHVELSVFDVTGRRVAVLLDELKSTGAHEIVWEGNDLTGQRVQSGVYFYKLSTDGAIHTRKMVRLD